MCDVFLKNNTECFNSDYVELFCDVVAENIPSSLSYTIITIIILMITTVIMFHFSGYLDKVVRGYEASNVKYEECI
jgi:hypothetical protein